MITHSMNLKYMTECMNEAYDSMETISKYIDTLVCSVIVVCVCVSVCEARPPAPVACTDLLNG